MTAGRSPVELLDTLDALRAKATADGEWRVLDIDNRPGPHSREILDDEGSVAVCSGDNDGTGNTIGADRAAWIVAASNATPELLRLARERYALERAVLELADGLDHEATYTLASAPKIAAKEDAADRIRAAVAAALTEGGQAE